MTCIAYRLGILAADSGGTVDEVVQHTQKLLRKRVGREEHIVALAGVSLGMQFYEWYGSDRPAPHYLEVGEPEENHWQSLVLTPHGLFYYNGVTVPERVHAPFYAIGSGAAIAIGAMAAGASARKAVEAAVGRDPYTRAPVVAMRIRDLKRRR